MKTRLVVASALVLGMIASAQAATGGNITNTRHNLGIGGVGVSLNAAGSRVSTNGNLGDIFTTGTDQICVFCHTPHGAVANPPAPLWNKGATGSTYKAYTMGGNMATGGADKGAVGGMSLACLTCHDGTQAMDNMMNSPGSGGWGGASGARAQAGHNGDGSNQATGEYNWYFDNSTANNAYGGDIGDGTTNGARGSLQGLPQMLGTDLSNDHPIGMVYGGGDNAGTTKNPEFNQVAQITYNGLNKFVVGYPALGSQPAYSTTWGDNSNFKLYGTTKANAKVECGTCHDPHIDSQKLFLRRDNTGSAVCLSCHIK